MNEREKAKAIIVQIVAESGGEWSGRTLLYKAFYGAHLFSFAKLNRVLSEWPVVKMPQGPGIDDGADLLCELVESGWLTQTTAYTPYAEYQYRVVTLPPPDTFTEAERGVIREAGTWAKRWFANALSEHLHRKSFAWKKAEMGAPLNIYLDLIPSEDLDRELDRMSELAQAFAAA